MNYLLDTNVISETRRAKPNPNLMAWLADVDAEDLYLSVLTIGEIAKGIEKLKQKKPAKAQLLETWLTLLQSQYKDRLIDITPAIAKTWGHMSARATAPVIDTLLAATAQVHGMILVTRNVADVAGTGVEWVNPWEEDN